MHPYERGFFAAQPSQLDRRLDGDIFNVEQDIAAAIDHGTLEQTALTTDERFFVSALVGALQTKAESVIPGIEEPDDPAAVAAATRALHFAKHAYTLVTPVSGGQQPVFVAREQMLADHEATTLVASLIDERDFFDAANPTAGTLLAHNRMHLDDTGDYEDFAVAAGKIAFAALAAPEEAAAFDAGLAELLSQPD